VIRVEVFYEIPGSRFTRLERIAEGRRACPLFSDQEWREGKGASMRVDEEGRIWTEGSVEPLPRGWIGRTLGHEKGDESEIN
jgi:hypothetical protein